MRVLLICVGSRGDAEPFCSLSDHLVSSGHQVDFFIQRDLQSLAPQGVSLHLLPFEQQDFYRFVSAPTHGADHENPRVRFTGVVADVIAELVFPCWEAVFEVAKQQCQVIVTSELARSLSIALSEKLNIPTCLVHLQPLVPTNAFPHFSHTEACAVTCAVACLSSSSSTTKSPNDDETPDKEGSSNKQNYLDTYWELEKFQYDFLEERLNSLYTSMELEQKHLSFTELQTMLSGNHPRIWVFNAFYKELIPAVQDDVGPQVHHVGALADSYVPRDFSPPSQELVEFLKEGDERPICIGYGSMPYEKVDLLLEFLKKSQRKAILVGKSLQIPSSKGNDETNHHHHHVRQVDSLPYAWLLPHCQMMLCHGGAGVVHATLRVGIPVVISPLMGDQFFYARLLQAKGLGTQAGGSLPTMSMEDLQKAVEEATSCVPAAKEFGERIRSQESGVERCVKILEDVVVKD